MSPVTDKILDIVPLVSLALEELAHAAATDRDETRDLKLRRAMAHLRRAASLVEEALPD